MHCHFYLVVGILALFIGCNQQNDSAPAKTIANEQQEQQDTPEKFTHTITSQTEYYTTGPQQGRPPDGELAAGSKVVSVENAGSYSLIKAEDGTQAYVASDTLEEIASNENAR